jgi:hypothetical protein
MHLKRFRFEVALPIHKHLLRHIDGKHLVGERTLKIRDEGKETVQPLFPRYEVSNRSAKG